jgi:hypothetical protein
MNRKEQKKRAYEKFLIRDFLESGLNSSLRRLVSRAAPFPDAYAVIAKNAKAVRVQIELTKYHVNIPSGSVGGSKGRRLQSFWNSVQASLRQRILPSSVKIDVRVTLKDSLVIPASDGCKFAAELFQFARDFRFPETEVATAQTFGASFPLLREYVQRLRLTKVNFKSFYWACSNAAAASVALLPTHVASLIEAKTARSYRWAKDAERWLLICASGDSIVETAGPRPPSQTWQDNGVREACASSPFERIYFWDRPHGWYRRLK